MSLRVNGGESILTVDREGDQVTITMESCSQGSHTASHSVTFKHPEFALSFAEQIREVAVAAKIYEENNPN